MRLSEVIKRVDDIKPNAFSNETKTGWINDCEGMVQTEVFLFAPVEIIAYEYDRDANTPLLVDAPHDKLYVSYLTAMVDFANGEYNRYQNTMQMFNAHFSEFMRYFAQRYRPADAYAEGLL